MAFPWLVAGIVNRESKWFAVGLYGGLSGQKSRYLISRRTTIKTADPDIYCGISMRFKQKKHQPVKADALR
jgi:hypothetical protein